MLCVNTLLCLCMCVPPGEGVLPGCAWADAATPPVPGYAGDPRGELWEDQDGGREGGSASKNFGITTEISARQSVGGHFPDK